MNKHFLIWDWNLKSSEKNTFSLLPMRTKIMSYGFWYLPLPAPVTPGHCVGICPPLPMESILLQSSKQEHKWHKFLSHLFSTLPKPKISEFLKTFGLKFFMWRFTCILPKATLTMITTKSHTYYDMVVGATNLVPFIIPNHSDTSGTCRCITEERSFPNPSIVYWIHNFLFQFYS